MTAPAIGIDLGTTNSCVGVFRNRSVDIIPNEEGSHITPSYVSFTDMGQQVGASAKEQLVFNSCNTVFDIKRLIGRKFSDECVQSDIKHWPFEVLNDNGIPKIKIQYKGETKILFPEQISSLVLSKMKEIAQVYLGEPVKKAVITVPAYFNDSQRQATKDAGILAGLNVLRVINEPTAAALAYGMSDNIEERNVLFFDLGGGTFDVSVLNIEEGVFEVLSIDGDSHLGGEDFDSRMVDYFIKEFNRKYDKSLRLDQKDLACRQAVARLRLACERAKRTLSTMKEAKIELELFYEGINFQSSITRARFEDLNSDLFERTITLVEKVIKDAGLSKSDISDVVLVGGSTRIPIVQSLLQEFFDGKELNKSVHPDEVVAYGAALQAAILEGNTSEELREVVLIDVTPLTLGVEAEGGIMAPIMPRNSTIPNKATRPFVTADPDDKYVVCKIFEGERPLAKDNNFLGSFLLTGIPPNHPVIEVTFEIDANGILTTSAVEKSNNVCNKLTVKADKGRLTEEEIEKIVRDAERFRIDDERLKATIEAKNLLECYCRGIKKKINKSEIKEIDGSVKNIIISKCNETLNWIESNTRADKNLYESKHFELKNYCDQYNIH